MIDRLVDDDDDAIQLVEIRSYIIHTLHYINP